MSRMSGWSMKWGAVLGGIVIALSGVRSAHAEAAAPAPTAAPAPAAAPADPKAADAEAQKKAEDEKKKKQAEAEAAAKLKLEQATSPAAAASAAQAAPAAAAPAVATPADVPAAAKPASATPEVGGTPSVIAAAPEAAKKDEDKPLYFNGLGMDLALGDSSGLYTKEGVYENNWSLALMPSWKAGERFFKQNDYLKKLNVSARFILSGEFSGTADQYRTGNVASNASYFQNCDSAAPSGQGGQVDTSNLPYCQGGSQRRLDYTDISLKVADGFYTVPKALIDVKGSLATALPISAESRAAGFVTSLQPGVGLSRSFFDKKLTIGYDFAFTKYFFKSNVPVYDQSTSPGVTDPHNPALGPNAVSASGLDLFAMSNGYVSNFSVAHALAVTYVPNDKFTFLGRYVIADAVKQSYPNCSITLANNPQLGAIDTCQGGSAVAAASGATIGSKDVGSQQFMLAGDYQIIDYLGAEIALVTAAPQRHPDGSWQQPFLTTDYKNYSSLNFSVTLTTEALVAKLLHKS